MIKYILKCHNEHEFESWFSNSNEFDNLKKKELLECILCSSKKIDKSIMAPMVYGTKENIYSIEGVGKNLQTEKNKLLKLRRFIENNYEFVGEDFSRKVREIYYDKKSKQMIYGTTTPKEKQELEEEGIDLLSVPWVSKVN
jgi:hypothetical protein